MSLPSWRPSRRITILLIPILLLAGAWLTAPATGNQFLDRILGGRPRGPRALRQQALEEEAAPRTGPELIDSPLDVQGAPRLSRAAIQQSAQASTGGTQLDQLVAQAIDLTSRRYLDLQQNPPYTPWQIMHGILALRDQYLLKRGNEYIRAIDYISNDPKFMGDSWFQRTSTGGRARPYNNVPYAFEGHINQTLALICMSNFPLEHEFRVEGGGTVTMQDMVNTAKATVNSREEITWTLWFLTHYCDQMSTWTNNEGEAWSLERLVKEQVDARVIGAPCGGCHQLFALAYARNAYLVQHGELRGAWFEADQKLQGRISAAMQMQNGDGSFSSDYFKSRKSAVDLDERIRTTGHMFEWLMMALPSSRLEEEWVRRAAARIATDLINSVNDDTEMGGMYHACHSLVLYQQRMEQIRSRETPAQPELAEAPQSNPQVSQPQTNEPMPLPLPSNPEVAELPQREDEAVVEEEVEVQNPVVNNKPPMTGVPLIVGAEPEVTPEPEVVPEVQPEIVQNETPETQRGSTPPLILDPELLTQDDEPVADENRVEQPEVTEVTESAGPRVPLITPEEPPQVAEESQPEVTEQSPPQVTEQTQPNVPLIVTPEALPMPEVVEEPAATPTETEVVQTPATTEPGASETGPSDTPTTTETLQPRVFTLTMPESTGNHKPRSATSAAPVLPGSRPVTGSAPATTPR
jgi:hypothetical protein